MLASCNFPESDIVSSLRKHTHSWLGSAPPGSTKCLCESEGELGKPGRRLYLQAQDALSPVSLNPPTRDRGILRTLCEDFKVKNKYWLLTWAICHAYCSGGFIEISSLHFETTQKSRNCLHPPPHTLYRLRNWDPGKLREYPKSPYQGHLALPSLNCCVTQCG